MTSIKTFILIFIFLTCFFLIKCDKNHPANTYSSRFRSIECQADNYTASVGYCHIKAVPRRASTVNVHFKALKPSYKPIYIQMILYYRYGNIYREVMDTKRIEWCSIMEGISELLFLMQTIHQIKEIATNAIHKCPYEADVEVKII